MDATPGNRRRSVRATVPVRSCLRLGVGVCVALVLAAPVCSFAPVPIAARMGPSVRRGARKDVKHDTSTVVRKNFFKDMIDQAFANDRTLPKDRGEAQYDKPGEEFIEGDATELTSTQKQWREKQWQNAVTPNIVADSVIDVSVFLAGVPSKDPSNDLYGNKVNISSRDKSTGLVVPDQSTATFRINLLPDGNCEASRSDFTSGDRVGQWKLLDDGKLLRFSFDVVGYTRTVQTTGSIQKIYWSNEEEKNTQTSSSYSIPPGWVYADIEVSAGRQPGLFSLNGPGVLRIEKTMGLLGAASKMVACGTFTASLVSEK